MKARIAVVAAVGALALLSCTLLGLGPPSGVIDGTVTGGWEIHVTLAPFGHDKGGSRTVANEPEDYGRDFYFRFDSLEAGSYRVSMRSAFRSGTAYVELADGEHRTVDFPLVP